MELIKPLLTALMAVWSGLSQPAMAEEPKEAPKQEQTGEDKLNVGIRTDLLGRYMFRGFTYSEKGVIQSTPSVTYGNFSVVGFANYDNDSRNFNETDLTLDFTKQIGKLWLSMGYTYLKFPNTTSNDTQEIYAITSLGSLLNPTLKVFSDIDDVKGTYIEATLNHEFNVKGVPLSVTGLLAYNHNHIREGTGFTHAELGFDAPIGITPNLTLKPMLRYSHAFDKTNLENMLHGGVSTEVNF